ncbi:uncharacterized protein LOC134458705 [Engraulis encrasicolus]|uniref:uncharacterized protein LOC134458705 n=1 Tax=Engraulis encrasicolus TaxID=184585 RepID=UPI002FCFBD1E
MLLGAAGREQQSGMEMTEGVYRKVDPDGGSSLSTVKSVEGADEVLNKTSNSTENSGDPTSQDSAGREQQDGMEMTEGIYRKVSPDGGSSLSAVKYVEEDEVLNKPSNSTENAGDPNSRHSGRWRSAAVCLGLLCTLLLCGIAVLSVQMMLMTKQSEYRYREKLQIQVDYDNMTSDCQQLQISYNGLKSVKAKLQDTNSNLTRENLQCQTRYASLSREKDHIQLQNNGIAKEKSELEKRYNDKVQLESSYKNLTSENSVLQGKYNNLLNEKSNLTTTYDNLRREKLQLEASYKNQNSVFQDRYGNLLTEKSKLQATHDNLTMRNMELETMDVTLDPETANNYLILSADGKQVKHGYTSHNRPDNLKRFDPNTIVLGKQGIISGRFYYEVQFPETSFKLTSFSYHCYGDDPQMYLSFQPDNSTVFARISTCLTNLSTWMKEHHLQFNLCKTELLVIPAKESICHNITLTMGSATVASK